MKEKMKSHSTHLLSHFKSVPSSLLIMIIMFIDVGANVDTE